MMAPIPEEIKTIELKVRQSVVSHLIDYDVLLHPDNVRVFSDFMVESMAYQLAVFIKTPAHEYQAGREICSYPETWWDAVKERLGWKHKRRHHYIDEYLMFPSIGVPDWAKMWRFHYHVGLSNSMYDYRGEDA